MKKLTYTTITLALAAILLTGCQESDAQMVKRARLVGNENLQLKKQLKDKDKEIQSLKDEIANLEKQREKDSSEFGDATIKTLQMFAESQKQVETLTAENNALKEQLKQLQSN